MKSPELSIFTSAAIAVEVAEKNLMLVPIPDNLAALGERLELPVPDPFAANLQRTIERTMSPEFRQVMRTLYKEYLPFTRRQQLSSTPPPEAHPIFIDELSEEAVLVGFASRLIAIAEVRRREHILKWGGRAAFTEFVAGAVVGLFGYETAPVALPMVGTTLIGMRFLASRRRFRKPVSLEGLASPVKIIDITQASQYN